MGVYKSLGTAKAHLWRYVTGSGTPSPVGTSAPASAAVSADLAMLSKTLWFKTEKGRIKVICAGDACVDPAKMGDHFSFGTVEMIPGEVRADGEAACPADVFLDESMLRFDTVFYQNPDGTRVELTLEELFKASKAKGWVDICRMNEGKPTR
jgi:prolyl-tRNA editing enzyme YbaK/EbsC (Cys-tRNA(Pro) deacylase)